LDISYKDKELSALIAACKKGKRKSQEELYKKFYPYAMGICLRYANDRQEAEEILNDGFLKIFTRISQHRTGSSFKSWLRKTLIHSAIDHYRKHQKHYKHIDIVSIAHYSLDPDTMSIMSSKEILVMVQKLSPAYRMVFVLHAIEGFKHPEIAEKLDISVGTSKSNLAKARVKLKRMLASTDKENFENYG